MADACMQYQWAALLALTVNCHRDPKKSSEAQARDFNPFARKAPPMRVGVGVLKSVFIDRQAPDVLKDK